jgi:uncharacterized membrane protein YfcA
MSPSEVLLLTLAVGTVAFLYASVGHAGASGYIAVLTLAGLAPTVVRPVALVLNILVAVLATWQFRRAGHFSWSLFWPFAALSIPCAFVGGYLGLPVHVFQVVVGAILLFSAGRFRVRPAADPEVQPPGRVAALGVGACLGLLSGLTGTGGGIFLTPLLLLMRWAKAKPAAAVSAPFILVNSASGLLGNLSSTRSLPASTWAFAAAVLAGGLVGAHLGSHRYPVHVIKRLLAAVLLVAGTKLILT